MNGKELKHHDCRNFIPVDVAKGICNVHKQMVLIDTPVCEKFRTLPKCKNCAHFTADPGQDTMGTCEAEKTKPWTFADLITVTCENYSAK
ncbi:MAG TPA: 4-hydroxyphenylacetate decarboxylase small subunit [Syntrophomonadaceae bacterium]|nr:4-hydroxyphenylacetate decarboxylase small subunit [Syntrophomonadaceae bacterium]